MKTYTYKITSTEVYELKSDVPLEENDILNNVECVEKWEMVDSDAEVEEI